jgi:SAM-dependent MidA family methyltransferase
MDSASAPRRSEEGELGIAALAELPPASSLLSSRWSHDNRVTPHPGRLYDGPVLETIGLPRLKELIAGLEAERGNLRAGTCRLGAHTWDVSCKDAGGPFVLSVPVALDEAGTRGRTRRDVPRVTVQHLRHFREAGLGRYVGEPRGLVTLAGGVSGALLPAFPAHHPVTFGGGSLRVELLEASQSFLLELGAAATAELLAELVAALAYHYDHDADGGTAITDVGVNGGDFVVRRRPDGTFDVRLTAVRRREGGIGPSLLLLSLVQLMAYEDWNVDGELVGLPVLVANPAVAFEGLVRGRRNRHRDLGGSEDEGQAEARRWLGEFGRAAEGRAYRPWVERFLGGSLPLEFGRDLRERWWRLSPLETKLGVLELRARVVADARAASSARAMKAFIAGLSSKIGSQTEDEPDALRVNDLDGQALARILSESDTTGPAAERLAAEISASWPYGSWDHLLARVPSAKALRSLKRRLTFGQVVTHAEQGSAKGAATPPRRAAPRREIANHEIFGYLPLAPAVHADAVATFPTFERFMDGALHHPVWGYDEHRAGLDRDGTFAPHTEKLSPHYGRWIARAAFEAFRILQASGELEPGGAFPIVELGTGNGRLAHDALSAARALASDGATPQLELFRQFAARLSVAKGDARRPAAALARDFPNGLRGFVLANQVASAFGVHKVLLARDGRAFAALVVPRAEPALKRALPAALAEKVTATNARLRERFGLARNLGDFYLDAETFEAAMLAIAEAPSERRDALRAGLWFEETLVPASHVPALAAHLAENAGQFALALAAEDSGIVLYPNVRADRFARELGASLRAGFVVTIDHGDTTVRVVEGARRGDFPFRVDADSRDDVPRPNDPYTAPGAQNLTADVNFTSFARAGEAAGLHVVHYGLERDVTGTELPLALRNADQERFATFLGNPAFKVLVQGTTAGTLFPGAPAPLPLVHGDDRVPEARRALIAAFERNLGVG